jgi:hypothetical protein
VPSFLFVFARVSLHRFSRVHAVEPPPLPLPRPQVPAVVGGLVLEGGALHVDGCGTCVTTAECLLGPNAKGLARNPGLSAAQVEAKLAACLGVTKVPSEERPARRADCSCSL